MKCIEGDESNVNAIGESCCQTVHIMIADDLALEHHPAYAENVLWSSKAEFRMSLFKSHACLLFGTTVGYVEIRTALRLDGDSQIDCLMWP